MRATLPILFLALIIMSGTAGQALSAPTVFDCVIDPSVTVKVGSSTSGLLASVSVKRGERVKKGQVLARLERSVEKATVELNRLRSKGTASIDAQKTRLDILRKQLERSNQLYKRKVVSEERLDDAKAAVAVAEDELEGLKLQHRLAQLELARSEKAFERLTIVSPIDGIVTQRNLSGGEFVHSESHILVLAKLDPLHVETFLPVKFFALINRKMVANVMPEQPFGEKVSAIVEVVDDVFDPSSGTFGVRLQLENPGNKIPAGQRCEVSFNLAGQ